MDNITALFAPVLRASWYTFCLTACIALGLPTDSWRVQTPENVFIDMLARTLEKLQIACIEAYRGMFLRYARGDWLSILAMETYETQRLMATFATGQGTLTNDGTATWPIPAGDVLAVGRSGIQVTYVIDGPLSIAPGTLTGLTIRCLTAGSAGSCAIGEINEVIGQTLPDVSVTNTTALTARDVELDADLSDRARKTTGPLSPNGPAAAYEYIARGGDINGTIDPIIAAIGVTKVKTVVDLSTGHVQAYFRTASGEVAAPDVDLINAKLLEMVVPLGTSYDGASASALGVNVDYNVRVLASENITEDDIREAIDLALAEFFPTVPTGGFPHVPNIPGQGELTLNKVIPVIGCAKVGDREPINYTGATLNGGASVGAFDSEFYVLGTVTGTVTFT